MMLLIVTSHGNTCCVMTFDCFEFYIPIFISTQTEKYGLSFVTLHSPPEVKDGDIPQDIAGTASSNAGKKIGIFSVKEEVTSLPSGSLFFKKGEKKDTNNGGSLAVKVLVLAEHILYMYVQYCTYT